MIIIPSCGVLGLTHVPSSTEGQTKAIAYLRVTPSGPKRGNYARGSETAEAHVWSPPDIRCLNLGQLPHMQFFRSDWWWILPIGLHPSNTPQLVQPK